VYYAAPSFDWRDLAVNAAAQTWSLLGGAEATACATEEPGPAGAGEAAAEGMQAPAAVPEVARIAPAPPPPTRADVDLRELGASFVRAGLGGDVRSAWEANREALRNDFKSKRRQALRTGKHAAARRKA
jgi:hypothetical protein